ncbi:hypothetical protein ABZ915_31125 [Streptomyces sp. NPDC046915]|uniref:hypothetical protein n=1 Tax=Streptomyces sp. NPDC046915 TaxID=3155257 RepID=UPI0033EA54DA
MALQALQALHVETRIRAGLAELRERTQEPSQRRRWEARFTFIDDWRCVPDADGFRFLAGYDHRPRRSAPGALAGRLLVRPLRGWATAWSLDRLRLWIERGITPERARRNWLAELAVRALVLTVCGTGLSLGPALPFFGVFGPLGAAAAFLCPLLLVVGVFLALFKAPLSCTPAARRCRRTRALPVGNPCVLRTTLGNRS